MSNNKYTKRVDLVQIVRLKELGYPGEINDLVEDALEWMESEHIEEYYKTKGY